MIIQDYLIGINDTFLLIISSAILSRDENTTTLTNSKGEILLLVNNDILDFIIKYDNKGVSKQLQTHYQITEIPTEHYIQ